MDVQVIGISFDTPAANLLFSRRRQFPFPLLSDEKRLAGLAYGACNSPSAPAAKRITYLIGADGVIEHAWSGLRPAEHARAVAGVLAIHKGATQS